MATLKDFRNERLRKVDEIRQLGINPYPSRGVRTHHINELVDNFDSIENQNVTVLGRIKSIRKFGKIAFIVIKDDSSAQLQLFIKTQENPKEPNRENSELELPKEISLLDSGDFVEASGNLIKTQTGEISVDVINFRILSKALRPLPLEVEGFTDKEQRLRRRYVDMQVNNEVLVRFIRRSNFWQATRDFLINNGFHEINIPVLEHTPGGADANPFVTHMDALDQDFYLRISHELPLKRLLVAGYEKVFDIGPRFRNENYSDEHLPEHIAMEWYWAYADWEMGMDLTEKMVRFIADKTWGKRKFELANGQSVDLGSDDEHLEKISFVELIKDKYGIDPLEVSLEDAVKKLKEIGGEVEKVDNKARVIDKLWKKLRVEMSGPVFLIDIPAFMQPLAKLQSKDNRLTEQFNLILGGTEACKAYSELNDPVDQYQRFTEQQKCVKRVMQKRSGWILIILKRSNMVCHLRVVMVIANDYSGCLRV
jgi:lysyl-tRNA synthetase class 2